MSVFWTWTANKLTLLTLALSFDTDYRTPLVRMAGSIPWTNQFVLHHPILQLFLSRAHAALQLKTSKKPLNNWKTSATTADKLIKPINWFELLLPWVFKTVPEWNCYCIFFFFSTGYTKPWVSVIAEEETIQNQYFFTRVYSAWWFLKTSSQMMRLFSNFGPVQTKSEHHIHVS